METESEIKQQTAGVTEKVKTEAEVKGKIVELLWHLKTEAYSDITIKNHRQRLTQLSKIANLLIPENVKEAIARQNWAEGTKQNHVSTYGKFASFHGLNWKPPKYKITQKLPFIPLESEIDSLVAGCGKKTATLLQLLKETGMRVGEALKLKWIDFDIERNVVNITPEKHGKPRQVKIPVKLAAMLNTMPKQSELIFNGVLDTTVRGNFTKQRRRIATKLANPRLSYIHFHTLRHWKATMEYAKTKDILHIMQLLGHRKIESTLVYTQLITFETDEYHSATAKTIDEAQKLIEAGFEYVCDFNNIKLFRKRK